MRIRFIGAAGEVTGSKHLVEFGSTRILLDCGAVQGGSKKNNHERNRHFDFDPTTLHAVVISHAHYDHVGLLPLLVKQGFRGTIYASSATRDLTELILLDAAHLQLQEAEYSYRHKFSDHAEVEPLYTPSDVPAVMERFKVLPYGPPTRAWTKLDDHVNVKLYDAGHILGSAVIVLEGKESDQTRRVVYTGDLGRWNRPLLRDPQIVEESAEIAICEATYGERLHHPATEVENAIIQTIQHAVTHQSQIVVPAFSLGRTQQLIYTLHWLTDQGRIPRIPIVVDSPLARRITDTFRKHQRDYDAQSRRDFSRPNEDPLDFSNLRFTQSVDESKALNHESGPLLILSASGMATGGRVIHHLRRLLPDSHAQILFTGYQAQGTLGRRLVNGEKQVRIFGKSVRVRAAIRIANDMSAHADASQIDEYLTAIDKLKRVYLVHAEPDRAAALKQFLALRHPNWDIQIPEAGQISEN